MGSLLPPRIPLPPAGLRGSPLQPLLRSANESGADASMAGSTAAAAFHWRLAENHLSGIQFHMEYLVHEN